MTIGVLSRVEQLADRPAGFRPEKAIDFKRLVPLDEIIAAVLGFGKGTKTVGREYQKLINSFGNELEILLATSLSELKAVVLPEIAEAILRVREGKLTVSPGYDGLYGKVEIFPGGGRKQAAGQKQLF
jgi:PHP family Zn ribbon phosphoesterase